MSTLDPTRVWRIVRLQVLLHGRRFLYYLGPVLAVTFLAALSVDADGPDDSGLATLGGVYVFVLLLAGFIWAARALPENNTPDGRQAFLTLPASDTEKWVGSYLYSGPLFYVAFTLAYSLIALVVRTVLPGINGVELMRFDAFTAALAEPLLTYFLIVHPLGLLAAIYFNKGSAEKGAGAIIVVLITLGLIGLLVFRIVFYDYFTGVFGFPQNLHFRDGGNVDIDFENYGWWLAAAFGVYLLAVSYFRFHEKEV